MAVRPVYVPIINGSSPGVEVHEVEFQWFPGMATSQKRKSIISLHEKAQSLGISKILEVSSKSEQDLGVSLSAFNLMIETPGNKRLFSVESAFQGSKVFENGGPYVDLLNKSSREAKKDLRIKESGNLINFRFYDKCFPLTPRTFFYDWLYANALAKNFDSIEAASRYEGFTDIEFNPKKSINCQAYSLALCVSLFKHDLLERIASPEEFLDVAYSESRVQGESSVQAQLF